MKYSSSLLQKFISIQDSPENIARNLILKTCEIEEIEERHIPETIVIGKVVQCGKHPDADKLSVCQVDCGKKGAFQILCGGSNVTAGIFVPVALTWTHFPKAGITIEPRKMRGLDSNGMICSKEELGINEDNDLHSIWSLAEDLEDISDKDLGTPLAKKFPRLEGFVMEVDNKSITNRPDLTWHWWAAAELFAMYQDKDISFSTIKKRYETFDGNSIFQLLEWSTKGKKKVVGKTEELYSYILLELNNVRIARSSFLTRLQMLDVSAQPRNNWVDFSNLFMLISGQPVHFFDAEKIQWNIIVRGAEKWELFTDLFGTTHTLLENDIVIADEKKILALAGIVGGLESGITENTENILVEIANFDPVAVRKTWTRLGLRTDAELRYEKNINPLRSLHCLQLFLDELKFYQKDLGTFEIGGLSYFVNWKLKIENWKLIEVNFEKMEQFIFWKEIKDFEIIAKTILQRLWFTFDTQHSTFNIPVWRSPDDMNIAEDIYEEVARIYWYDAIETIPLHSNIAYVEYSPEIALTRKIEDVLVRNFHCNQTETYPRIGDKTMTLFDIPAESLYKLSNPTNPETPYLRDNILYGLLNHVIKNHKFFDTFTLFDIGKTRKKGDAKTSKQKQDQHFARDFVQEEMHVGIIFYQKDIKQRNVDPFLSAKDMVTSLLAQLGLSHWWEIDHSNDSHFHPKKQATITLWSAVVWMIGSIHPLVLQALKLPEQAGLVYADLSLDALATLLENNANHVYTYETLQDQIIWRDLCFVVDADKEFAPLLEAVKKVPEVKGMEVFDIYAGKNIGEGKKSVSIKIKIIGDGEMTTEQINAIMSKAIAAGEKAGWTLRG